MRGPRRLLLYCCLALSTSSFCWSQQAPGNVSVRRVGQDVVVSISRSSSVGTVLQAVCRQLELQCEIPSVPQTLLPVAPMVLKGKWTQVLTKVVEGTELNFVAFPPNGKGGGRVVVQVQSRGLAVSQPNSSMVAASPEPVTDAPSVSQPTAPVEPEQAYGATQDTNVNTGMARNSSQGMFSRSSTPSSGSYGSTSGPLPGIPSSQSAPGPPLPGILPAASTATGIPLPGIPIARDRVTGPPLP